MTGEHGKLTNKTLFLRAMLVNTNWPMSYEPPTPPAELPIDVVDTLDDYSPELLRHVARYADELAEYREREARLAEDPDHRSLNEIVDTDPRASYPRWVTDTILVARPTSLPHGPTGPALHSEHRRPRIEWSRCSRHHNRSRTALVSKPAC